MGDSYDCAADLAGVPEELRDELLGIAREKLERDICVMIADELHEIMMNRMEGTWHKMA